MSSDIARGVIAKLREENAYLRRQIESWKWLNELMVKENIRLMRENGYIKYEPKKRHAKNRRRA